MGDGMFQSRGCEVACRGLAGTGMSRPARVLLYVHDLRASGVVVNTLALARFLGRDREVVLVAGIGGGLNANADLSPARLVSLFPDGSKPGKLAVAWRLRGMLKRVRPDILLSMGNLGHRAVLWGSAGLRMRRVFRISNELGRPGDSRRTRRRERKHAVIARAADKLILVGRRLARQKVYADALESGRAVLIPNGVDVERARQLAAAPTPHPWLEGDGPPVVLTVGRIHPQKNLGTLIDAFALARADRPLRLIILGSGDPALQSSLEARATALGIADDVLFAGVSANVFAWLSRSAVFALVSWWEGSSTALLEAMAVDCPIVASREAGDAGDVLDEGAAGLLVGAADPRAIADAILAQVEQPLRPGSRVEQFRLEVTHRRYAEALAGL